jgi:hypothetical protein
MTPELATLPFVTRYLALGNLWRRLALNLYGMGFQNYDDGTTGPVYRPGADAATRPSIPCPPSTGRDPCTNAPMSWCGAT